MRRSRSVARRAPWCPATVGLLATFVSFAVLTCGVAVADTVETNFESFTTGSVNGQDGWKSTGPYDQGVVATGGSIDGFGTQSLRMSNAVTSGNFSDQTYSKPTTTPAGETQANTEYTAQFSFISTKPDAEQRGLALTVSPDSYEGSRMSWVALEDTPTGIRVTVSDSPEVDGEFVSYDAGLLDRKVPHTIKFWIKVNPGVDNDLVRIYIDGRDVGRALGECFTTWENYYRVRPTTVPPPNPNTPATINSLEFRSGGTAVSGLAGGGYLFDNVSVTTANGTGPEGCGEPPPEDIDIDKTTQTRSAAPGDLITYRITVRNRGDAAVRRLRACDRAPRALRYVRSTHRLRRAAGRRLCLTTGLLRPGQRTTFRATFRLRANVTADTVTNGATADTPIGSAPSPLPPDTAVLPEQRRRRVARDSRAIRVVRTAPGDPRFVG